MPEDESLFIATNDLVKNFYQNFQTKFLLLSVEYYTLFSMKRDSDFFKKHRSEIFWWGVISVLVIVITVFHYTTPTGRWQYHLIYMQSYFVPILIGAFQFGIRGGLGVALAVSLIYFPHIMLQWGGLVENNLMRFMQIALFNVIGYVTGIKAQKEMEEKKRVKQTAKELENSLAQLKQQSEKLSELEEQLRMTDRLAVVGELTSSLAHEVRNPLGAIRGTVEILQDELPGEMKQSEFFRILIQETECLNSVVENYLSFARKQKDGQIQYDVCEVIRNMSTIMATQARRERIRFVMDLPDMPLVLKGDPNNLRQILANLLLNAIQAMPHAGKIYIEGKILSADEAPEITAAEGMESKPVLYLAIRDEGTGIEPDKLNEIFKPFFTTKKDGTGLGLSIVKRIADENKWRIDVSSTPGSGTQFTLFIPINDEKSD
ncbi:MAG: nitrogen regulation protein NR(II) [Calditrichia bacterium]